MRGSMLYLFQSVKHYSLHLKLLLLLFLDIRLETLSIAHIHLIFSKYYNAAKVNWIFLFKRHNNFLFHSFKSLHIRESSDIPTINYGQKNVPCLVSFFDNRIRCLLSVISGQMVSVYPSSK